MCPMGRHALTNECGTVLDGKSVTASGPARSHFLLFAPYPRLVCGCESVGDNSLVDSPGRPEKAMTKLNSSFWGQKEGIRPDLLCGRSADHMYSLGHFTMLACCTIVLGGRWWLLNLTFPLPLEPWPVQTVITTTSKEGSSAVIDVSKCCQSSSI